MLSIFLLISKTIAIEGRVFCQDSFASPWNPVGYPCPVSCSAVVTAVNRLKTSDHQRIQNENENESANNLNAINWSASGDILRSDLRKHNSRLDELYGPLFSKKMFLEDLEQELSNLAAILGNRTRRSMAAARTLGGNYSEALNARNIHEHRYVLTKLTAIFNKYSEGRYRYDEKTSQMILEEMVSHLELRFGVSDVRRILHHLMKMLRYSRAHARTHSVVTLRATHCITIRLPGCSCRRGYVEQSGQCVKPSDCIDQRQSKDYLQRIIFE